MPKEYKKDGLIITWEPKICIHAGVCVKTLPNVYKPNDKPWINAENASNEELIKQIDACPSQALKYIIK